MEKERIGLIAAIETEAVFSFYGSCEQLSAPAGFELYKVDCDDYELFILKSGLGEINAAAGVQYLITACGVGKIINFGVVGGLCAEMSMHKLCAVERVVHYKYDCSEFMDLKVGQVDGHDSIYLPTDDALLKTALETDPSLITVTCCSGDKFVSTADEKIFLRETFGGDICDMESAGIVLACELNSVPCLLLKAVSDGLLDGAEGFYKELLKASLNCLKTADKVIKSLIKRG